MILCGREPVPRTNESVLSCSYISSVVALALGVAEAMLQTRSWPKDRDEMERTVLEAPGLVVVDFTANWCVFLSGRARSFDSLWSRFGFGRLGSLRARRPRQTRASAGFGD